MCDSREITLEDMLLRLEQSRDEEMELILRAIICRYGKLYPDWEIVFLSLPRNDPALRRQTIKGAVELLNMQE